ncbi:hypothetical protein LCGC14_0607390 [marine sediment metagenome]|uniref:Uncharacterized protein n=1 Tax=marine sediment metagenome TaxID=412755 RepID=A0A0F9UH69_9ZZZZ
MVFDRALYNAMVGSGDIRYEALPAAVVPIADDAAWDQLFAAAGAPAVDYWLCGIAFNWATGIVAESTLLVDVGWGGADGAAIAAANVILTNWPVSQTSGAAAVGPDTHAPHMLPFPVKIPGGSRMAARIASSPTGTLAFTDFRVILATVVEH